MKRLLDCNYSDIQNMSKTDLLEAIKASEGRIIASEVIGIMPPLLMTISNAELAAAFGADILFLNMLDVDMPIYFGIPNSYDKNTAAMELRLPMPNPDIVKDIKRLTGKIIGLNLEPVDESETMMGEKTHIPKGRQASVETARKAYDMGVDMIVLTGNPGTGVSNRKIESSLRNIKEALCDKLILVAGKMHAAGSLREAGAELISKEDIAGFVQAGADIILLPAPGTVPGFTMDLVRELVMFAQSLGAMTITAIGTSQEGADTDTIKQIALMAKMTGTDVHHLGDGYFGMAIPENIMDYSIVIRGRRHTYARMARSINR